MIRIPDLTDEERKKLPGDLIAILQDSSFWSSWDNVIEPANGLLWDYFRESIGYPAFYSGTQDSSEQWKKFQGAWRPPDGYESWTGGTKYADKWFKDRGTEFIKQISDTDRDKVKGLLVKHWGIGEREFAKKIKEEYLFSPVRAKAIYRTEVHMTHEAGNFSFAYDNGARFKSWLGNQAKACPICIALNGQTIAIKEPFSNGSMFAHAHPLCRCTTLFFMESQIGKAS